MSCSRIRTRGSSSHYKKKFGNPLACGLCFRVGTSWAIPMLPERCIGTGVACTGYSPVWQIWGILREMQRFSRFGIESSTFGWVRGTTGSSQPEPKPSSTAERALLESEVGTDGAPLSRGMRSFPP
jgi:hypothetical protein